MTGGSDYWKEGIALTFLLLSPNTQVTTTQYNSSYYSAIYVSWSGKTVSWYSQNSNIAQLNYAGIDDRHGSFDGVYHWIAVG